MNVLISILLVTLYMGVFACTESNANNVQQADKLFEPLPESLQPEHQDERLKIYKLDVEVGGKIWPRDGVRIEQSELMKLDSIGPFQLAIVLKGPPIEGQEFSAFQFSFAIPSAYDGSPIQYDLARGESGVSVISFSEDNEVFTTWSAPWIVTWDEVNKKAVNEPKTSGIVTLERFDSVSKRLRITFDASLFGTSSDGTTSAKAVKGTIELDFAVYDLLAEAEKMKKQYGL